MSSRIRATVGSEWGQTMSEYAVVLGVITIAGVAAFGTLSVAVRDLFEQVATLLS
jgi:Flp pilus assembly pilin Flp